MDGPLIVPGGGYSPSGVTRCSPRFGLVGLCQSFVVRPVVAVVVVVLLGPPATVGLGRPVPGAGSPAALVAPGRPRPGRLDDRGGMDQSHHRRGSSKALPTGPDGCRRRGPNLRAGP